MAGRCARVLAILVPVLLAGCGNLGDVLSDLNRPCSEEDQASGQCAAEAGWCEDLLAACAVGNDAACQDFARACTQDPADSRGNVPGQGACEQLALSCASGAQDACEVFRTACATDGSGGVPGQGGSTGNEECEQLLQGCDASQPDDATCREYLDRCGDGSVNGGSGEPPPDANGQPSPDSECQDAARLCEAGYQEACELWARCSNGGTDASGQPQPGERSCDELRAECEQGSQDGCWLYAEQCQSDGANVGCEEYGWRCRAGDAEACAALQQLCSP